MGLMGLMALMGLMGSCTSDLASPGSASEPEQQVEPEQSVPMQMEVVSYVMPFEDYEATRAWTLPDGYSEDTNHKAIGAFFTKDSPVSSDARRFWYNDFGTPEVTSDDKWFISGKEIPTGDFYLYGFMPYNAATDVTVACNTVDAVTSYEKGAILTFNGLGSVMTKDVCVMVGAKNGTDANTPVAPVKLGQFGCTMSGGTGSKNYLFLLFEHIYAKVDFCFRVDEEYAKLRTIKLKELTLMAYTYTKDDLSDFLSNPTPMKKYGSIRVELKANSTNKSPIDNAIYFTPDNTPGARDMDPELLFEGEETLPSSADKYPADYEVVELRGKDKYTEETGFVPYFNFSDTQKKVLYVIRSTYDVYDNNKTTEHPDGNLIRLNQQAENMIVPYKLFNESQLEAGKRYRIYLTVKPTYLYVMSEEDIDNPTVELN